ncbi:MAG TPA: hypothetical protein VHW44_23120, partial [Pseudonocardiaceae bacterium]|nr:hypothetical protein [Pseudonocardiaceae bacterium]
AAPRYWQPNNPVVVVSGVDPAPAAVPTDDLAVRLATHLVTGFTAGGALINATAVAGLVAQLPNLTAVPTPAAAGLLTEFLLLDPGNAAQIAATTGHDPATVTAAMTAHDPTAYQGPLPQLDLGPWAQPWQPMFLEWSSTYTYVPFSTGPTTWWTFDGTDYRFTPGVGTPPTEQRAVGGVSLLSPHASSVFGSRLDNFVRQFGSASDLAQVDAWVEQVYGWRFLAQELTGFNELLSLRDSRAFRRPTATDLAGPYPVAALTGYGDGVIPAALALPESDQSQVNTVPYFPNGPAIPFHGARQGELYFTDLYLYDKFGRTLFVIESGASTGLFDYRNFPLLMDQALVPDARTITTVASVVQLPPRILQHARIDFRLLDGHDDSKLYEVDAGVNPIAGWVLPNHLDGSILVYAPDGTALGEFGLVVQADGSKIGQWQPPPHTTLTLADVGTAAPHLRDMLVSAQLSQEAGFQAFLAAIDTTLWTTDPLGNRVDQNLSVLIGRPLALVRTRLQLQVDGDPITDTGWAATLAPPTPDFLSFPFSLRLGDQLTREDGVIGYFAGSDYDVFNSVAAADSGAGQSYVSPIGPVGQAGGNYLRLSFTPDTYSYVTVLADPRAAIHVTTGILPVKQLDIPQQFVDPALSTMEISFRMGPVLTVRGPSPDEGTDPPEFADSIVYPLPAEQNGSWSWWERDAAAGTWAGYGLVKASPDATAGTEPNSLRDGYVQFIANLEK